MQFVYGMLTGFIAGGTVVWIYKQKAIASIEKELAALKSGILHKLS